MWLNVSKNFNESQSIRYDNEQRKYAILFAATILAARKLNEIGSKPWAIHVAITDVIEKANQTTISASQSDSANCAETRTKTGV